MRRNFKSILKFLFLVVTTVICTYFLLKIIAPSDELTDSKTLYLINGNEAQSKQLVKNNMDDKIDWHDYKHILYELQRKGLGEQGKEAKIDIDESLKVKLYSTNGYNGALSDLISVNRSLSDIRHPGCKTKLYLKNLPTVSVVVPFYNEHWSTLLRTAYSVINRSPKHLLKEVILVDDGSTKENLKEELDNYTKFNMTNVKVLHHQKRIGLIKARLTGAKAATGQVLIFLDSHTEANVNWLPPLLEPIAIDYRTCVCPFIDVIDYETYQYRAQDEGARGAFDWEFFYKRLPLLPEDIQHPSEPFKSPIMAGGLFAISAKWFWEIGGYDEELQIWGGEQYELSFKIWQCGGKMLDAPCSRVGHIYRKFGPFENPGIGDFVGRNYRRVAEVWMDEYAEYIYKRRPQYRLIDPGDLTKQRAIREKLHCKPFKWFMENIAFDLVKKYPPIEPEDFAKGQVKSAIQPRFCVGVDERKQDARLKLELCDKNNDKQNYVFSWRKDIRIDSFCWDVSLGGRAPVNLYPCHTMGGNQFWKYDTINQFLRHGGGDRCLQADFETRTLAVAPCNEKLSNQKWKFTIMNPNELKKQE